MYSKEDIINFINNFKNRVKNTNEVENLFLNGNCYYFAIILKSRFPKMDIIYSTIDNHFMCLYDYHIYDIRGDITNIKSIYDLYLWDNYKNFDKTHYKRIIKYCINLDK